MKQSSGELRRENAKACLQPHIQCRRPASAQLRTAAEPGPISARPVPPWIPALRRNAKRRCDLSGTRRERERLPTRSGSLTIFWRCSCGYFSSRNGLLSPLATNRQRFWPKIWGSKGSGNADSWPNRWDFGGGGSGRRHDPGRAAAHPPDWRASSYLPLRAGWAPRAWALRGWSRLPDTSSALKTDGAKAQKEFCNGPREQVR